MIEAYFSNIEQQIIKKLSVAEHQVFVAVAWFTNEVLFEELLKCLKRGLSVSVIIMDDYINRNELALDFTKFIEAGGLLYFSKEKKMHNKFCIIDSLLITGSYNWTYYAEKLNCENIIFIDDVPVVQQYTSEYNKLQDSFTKITKYEPLKLKQITETDILNDYNYLCNDLFLKGQKYKDEIVAFNKERDYKVKIEKKESNTEYDSRGIPLLKKDFNSPISRRRLINFSIGIVPYGRPHGGRKYVHAKCTFSDVHSEDFWVDIFDPEYVNEVSKFFRKYEGGLLDDASNIVPIPDDIYNPFQKYGFIPVDYIFYKFGKYGNKRRKYGINGNIIVDKGGIPYEYDSFDTLIRYDDKTKKYIGFGSKTELCHLIVESLFIPNGIDDYDIISDYYVMNGVFKATIDDYERICREAEGTGMPNSELSKEIIKDRLSNNPEGFWLYKENSTIFSYGYGVIRDNYPINEYQKSHNDMDSKVFVLLRLKASRINYNSDKFGKILSQMIKDLKQQGITKVIYKCPNNQIQEIEKCGFRRHLSSMEYVMILNL
jgi:uncharacterized protein YozE (UPF0346 family)